MSVLFASIIRFLLLSILVPSVMGLGENRIFQIRDAITGEVQAITATKRAERSYRPGFPVCVWVADLVWENPNATGLDPYDLEQTGNLEERKALVQRFAAYVEQTLVAPLEGMQQSFRNPENAALGGLHFLLLDVPDGYSPNEADDQRKGSAVLARFEPQDLDALSGLNAMNLVQVDLNPGTLGRRLQGGGSPQKTLFEVARGLARLLWYQIKGQDSVWLEEGFSQYVAYRLLNQKPSVSSNQRVLDVPSIIPDEVSAYAENPYSSYPGMVFERQNQDRVYFFQTPRDLRDNQSFQVFRGFSWLFFTWLFERTGGNFLTQVSNGDRFFRRILQSSQEGVAAIEDALQPLNLQFKDLVAEYYDRLNTSYQDQTQGTLKASLNRPLGLNRLQSVSTDAGRVIATLEPFQAQALKIEGQASSGYVSAVLRFSAGLQNLHLSTYREDDRFDWHIQENVSVRAAAQTTRSSATILQTELNHFGRNPLILLAQNFADSKRQLQAEASTVALTRGLVFVSGTQDFGAVTTAIEIEDSDLPSEATSRAVPVRINGAGIFEITVTNQTTEAISWSLNPLGNTTEISLHAQNPQRLSRLQASLSNAANQGESVLVQRSGSRLKLVLLHEQPRSAEMELTFARVPASVLPDQTSTAESAAPPLSEEEYRKLAGGGGGGGCFIVTAACGSKGHPMVLRFSAFRDNVLFESEWGQSLIRLYYHYSPALARSVQSHPFFPGLLFSLLWPVSMVLDLLPALLIVLLSGLLGLLPAFGRRSCT